MTATKRISLTGSQILGDPSFVQESVTVGEFLLAARQNSPDILALVFDDPKTGERHKWTYREFYEASDDCARRLSKEFNPGERIAVWADNRPEWLILQFGTALAGLVLVTVNPAYKEKEAEYVLTQSGASACFAAGDYRGRSLFTWATSIANRHPELRLVRDLQEWIASASSGADDPLPVVSAEDPAMIQYTSGTTGFPKGALLQHQALTASARRTIERIELVDNAVWLITTPLFHVAGSVVAVLGSVSTHTTIVLMSSWSADAALELIESFNVTATNMVPTMLHEFVDHPEFSRRDLSSLATVMSGAATVSGELVRKLETGTRAKVQIMFGQTETAGCVTMTRAGDSTTDREETIGYPLSGIDIKIVDIGSGATLPIGQPGELLVRHGTMMSYYENPEATASALDSEGWLRTGDLCTMDERGYLRVRGRIKEMIIRGGENIYPREVEERLMGVSSIQDIAIVGVPSSRWGEEVAAVVVVPDPQKFDITDVASKLRSEMAGYKVPSRWFLAEALPRTPTGKIQKFRIQQDAAQGKYPEL